MPKRSLKYNIAPGDMCGSIPRKYNSAKVYAHICISTFAKMYFPMYLSLFVSVCAFALDEVNDNNNLIILAWHSVVVFFLKSSMNVRCVLEWEIFCYLLSFTFEYPNRIFRACRNNVLKLFHQRLSCQLLKTKVSPSLSLILII